MRTIVFVNWVVVGYVGDWEAGWLSEGTACDNPGWQVAEKVILHSVTNTLGFVIIDQLSADNVFMSEMLDPP